jgi:hypothetical protein
MLALALAIVHTAACGSSSPSAVDAGGGSDVTLSINNYLAWCTVTEQSEAYMMSMEFPTGTVVNLDAMPVADSFVWGYWTGTDGDTTTAHDTSMSTTVTMTGNKMVQACCPFTTAPSTPCPAFN